MADCLQVIPTWLSKLSGMSYRKAEKDPNNIKVVIIGFFQNNRIYYYNIGFLSEIKSYLLTWKENRICHPKMCHFSMCIILNCWQSRHRRLKKKFLSPSAAWKNLDRRPSPERELLPAITFCLKDLSAWQSKYLFFSSYEQSSSPVKFQVPISFLGLGWNL